MEFTDQIIRDVLLNGIYDSDIRREVLGTHSILDKPVNDVVALVENKDGAPSPRHLFPPCRPTPKDHTD